MKDVEYEGKILNIDVKRIQQKLASLKAKKVSDYNYKRYVFDVIPKNKNRWIRLRTDGKTTTLTVKEISSVSVDGTFEWEVSVSDFDKTLKILSKMGIEPRGYQENKREEYLLDSVAISIDQWPKLNPYLEIEGKDKESVYDALLKLGYDESDMNYENTKSLYKAIGIDIKNLKTLKF